MDFVSSPTALRRWAVASLAANLALVVTGGLVRVTGSGLGCSTWPQCEPGSYLPHGEADIHTAVEFGNRMLTFVLTAIAIGTFWAAWRARDEAGKPRRDLRTLALVAGLGIPAQAVIGGLSVLTSLNPWVVSLHLLASIAIIVVCVALVHRAHARQPVAAPAAVVWLTRAVFGVGLVVVLLGTVVTGAGPNSGDGGAERNGLAPEMVARVHSLSVWATLACLIALLVIGRQLAAVRQATTLVLAVAALQGVVGYTQYSLGNPPALVAVHMLGTALFTAGIAHLLLSSRPAATEVGVAFREPSPVSRTTVVEGPD